MGSPSRGWTSLGVAAFLEIAEGFALARVDEPLAACVGPLPAIRSRCRRPEVADTGHEMLLIEAAAASLAARARRLPERHPHEVPAPIAVPVTQAHGPGPERAGRHGCG